MQRISDDERAFREAVAGGESIEAAVQRLRVPKSMVAYFTKRLPKHSKRAIREGLADGGLIEDAAVRLEISSEETETDAELQRLQQQGMAGRVGRPENQADSG